MRITRNQFRKIVRESMEQYQPQKSLNYNQVSPGMKSMANSAKRQFAKDYPEIKVGIDGRQGWITVDGRKAVNISSASGSPMSIEDMVDQMKQAYLGHPMQESTKMKITRRQIRRIIKEYGAPGIGGQGNDSLGSEITHPDQVPIGRRSLGWADFQGMAQTGDYSGAADWLQAIAFERGLSIDREIEDMMIQQASDETVTANELEAELSMLVGV